MCALPAFTPCALIEYSRLALFLNVITICSPTSALIIGPTGERKTHVSVDIFMNRFSLFLIKNNTESS